MERKIDVRNLRVSFRTNNGTVKAVRGINLQLNKGETLAVVGESGSGKSVTARAMLGILAPNSIVESGEILYDGKDLLKMSEEEFHDYRGNRISMIFQDPMSSLNPIMKIGKQLTEAMILNGKANQRTAKKEFNTRFKLLKDAMLKAAEENKSLSAETIQSKMEEFKKLSDKGIELTRAYYKALNSAKECANELAMYIADIKKDEPKNIKDELKETGAKAKQVFHVYVISKENTTYEKKLQNYLTNITSYNNIEQADTLISSMQELKEELEPFASSVEPDFLAMAYYQSKKPAARVTKVDINKLNKEMRDFFEKDFLKDFTTLVAEGIRYSDHRASEAKKETTKKLKDSIQVYEKKTLDQKECEETAAELTKLVENSVDRLALKKDNLAYVFGSSLHSAIKTYFEGIPKNQKEEQRFAADTEKYNKAVAKGKDIGKPIPALIVDLELAHENMILTVKRLYEAYDKEISATTKKDYKVLAQEMIEHLYIQAHKIVHKITKGMAKYHAIELMQEVGIPEARKRYKQYPFEFSGGMRQRIVIAIALAANPDILICDEPTTALDVTIQSQILELINRLKVERQLSIIFITHDLGVVANMADRIAVMYAGKIVEYGTVDEIFYEPAHPYTWALLSSMPDLDTKEKLEAIPGTPPNMIHPPKGDAFAARNKYAMQIDFEEEPPLFKITPTHFAATWLLHPNAPKVKPPKIVTDRIERMKKLEVADNE